MISIRPSVKFSDCNTYLPGGSFDFSVPYVAATKRIPDIAMAQKSRDRRDREALHLGMAREAVQGFRRLLHKWRTHPAVYDPGSVPVPDWPIRPEQFVGDLDLHLKWGYQDLAAVARRRLRGPNVEALRPQVARANDRAFHPLP